MKRFIDICCLLFVASVVIAVHAQTVQHVIAVIMENRTPDNLFYGDGILWNNGGNVRPPGQVPSGPCKVVLTDNPEQSIPLTPYRLDACFDTKHTHSDWLVSYNQGQMNGACHVGLKTDSCPGGEAPPCQVQLPGNLPCPAYTYVGFSTPPGVINPYYQLAHQYGFANYMFETPQGPSFPAHQFLFSGTSAPFGDPNGDDRYQWFAGENPFRDNGVVGCAGPGTEYVPLIDTMKSEGSCPDQSDRHCLKPCYTHNTLPTKLDANNINWGWFGRSGKGLWDAPNSMSDMCVVNQNGECDGQEWNTHVKPYLRTQADFAPILTILGANPKKPIANCTDNPLPPVSWVIPDGRWSDHPGTEGHDGGPSFVAAVVNAVGGYDNSGQRLPVQCNYWQNTVILVVWDDWGGWYDHVSPDPPSGLGATGYPNLTGGQYVHGFRVPLLVISRYTKQTYATGSYTGYVSGPRDGHVCDGSTNYCHDFGSILRFIEHTFGVEEVNFDLYDFADHFAPDAFPYCQQSVCPYALSDFFGTTPHDFVPITGAKYPTNCFPNPGDPGCFSSLPESDPDLDAVE